MRKFLPVILIILIPFSMHADFCLSYPSGFSRPGIDLLEESEAERSRYDWLNYIGSVIRIGNHLITPNYYGFSDYTIRDGKLWFNYDFELPGISYDVVKNGDYLYFLTGTKEINIVDYSDPDHPFLSSRQDLNIPAAYDQANLFLTGGDYIIISSGDYFIYKGAGSDHLTFMGLLERRNGSPFAMTDNGFALCTKGSDIMSVNLANKEYSKLLHLEGDSPIDYPVLQGNHLVIVRDDLSHVKVTLSLYLVTFEPMSLQLTDKIDLPGRSHLTKRTPPTIPSFLIPDEVRTNRLLGSSDLINISYTIDITNDNHLSVQYHDYSVYCTNDYYARINVSLYNDEFICNHNHSIYYTCLGSHASACDEFSDTVPPRYFYYPAAHDVSGGYLYEEFSARSFVTYRYDLKKEDESLILTNPIPLEPPQYMTDLPYAYTTPNNDVDFSVHYQNGYLFYTYVNYLVTVDPGGEEHIVDLYYPIHDNISLRVSPHSLMLTDKYLAYTVNGYAELVVFNVDNPMRPFALGIIENHDYSTSYSVVAMENDMILAATYTSVDVVTINEDGYLKIRSTIDTGPDPFYTVGLYSGIYYYVQHGDLHSIDLHDPDHPQPIESIPLTNLLRASSTYYLGLVGLDKRLYLRNGAFLMEVDIRDARRAVVMDVFELRHGGKIIGVDESTHSAVLMSAAGYELIDLCGTDSPHELPFGWLDSPAQGESVHGDLLEIKGWAIDPDGDGINTVQVLVDGVIIPSSVETSLERGDVAQVKSDFPDALHSGFLGEVDLSSIQAGGHRMRVRVYDGEGNFKDIGVVDLNLTR